MAKLLVLLLSTLLVSFTLAQTCQTCSGTASAFAANSTATGTFLANTTVTDCYTATYNSNYTTYAATVTTAANIDTADVICIAVQDDSCEASACIASGANTATVSFEPSADFTVQVYTLNYTQDVSYTLANTYSGEAEDDDSNLLIWGIVIGVIVVVVIAVVAGIAGFVYWKKKKAAASYVNYVFYNHLIWIVYAQIAV